MPFYDLVRTTSTNAAAGTASTHLWGKTAANQETLSIMAAYATARFGTAGGATLRVSSNSGTTASGGTAQTAQPKNLRSPAAASIWANDGTAITAGTTLTTRLIAGFAQTGGQGGVVPVVPGDALQMMANATNPIDVEVTSVASAASVPFDLQLDILEGIA